MADPFQRILLPIDFSSHCDAVAEYAVWFARASGGRVQLVHVISNPLDELYASEGVTRWELVDHAERTAMQMLRTAGERCLPASCRRDFVVLVGDPFEKIIQAAAEFQADVIVMSTHGRGGVAHLVMGSVAEKVVRYATCPVFVVRRTNEAK